MALVLHLTHSMGILHRHLGHGDEETLRPREAYTLALRVVVLVRCNYHLRFVYICSLYLPFCGTQVLLAVDKIYIYIYNVS